MEDYIVLDGKKYISSKRAAQLGGYTKDYIGQMCRSGKLNAKLLGRNWYILENSLLSHKGGKKGSKSAKSMVNESSISYTKETPVYKVLVDDRPLNPTPVKASKTTVRVVKRDETKIDTTRGSKLRKVVSRRPVVRKGFPILKVAIVLILLVVIATTVFTEGKIVYDGDSKNIFAGVELAELNGLINEIRDIISF